MNDGLKPKHQRLVLVLIALAALIGAVLLAAWALKSQASYFFVPSEMAAHPPAVGQAVRLGGMVERGSLKRDPDGVTINFVVGDGKSRVPVRFSGIVPDLFVEGSGVVAEGRLEPNGIYAGVPAKLVRMRAPAMTYLKTGPDEEACEQIQKAVAAS